MENLGSMANSQYTGFCKITHHHVLDLQCMPVLILSSFSTPPVPLNDEGHLWECPKVLFKTISWQSLRWSSYRNLLLLQFFLSYHFKREMDTIAKTTKAVSRFPSIWIPFQRQHFQKKKYATWRNSTQTHKATLWHKNYCNMKGALKFFLIKLKRTCEL